MCGAVGRSGLPMPRSITSWPAARARAFMAFTSAKTYGGRRFRRWNSLSSIVLSRSEVEEDLGPAVGRDAAGGVGGVLRLGVRGGFGDDRAARHAQRHELVGDVDRAAARDVVVALFDLA